MKNLTEVLLKVIIIIIMSLSLSTNIFAKEIIGIANITDGDTINILQKKIRLHGIDAPEKAQKCSKNNKDYYCGLTAKIVLKKKVNKNIVTCKVQKKKDRYGRYIGVCFSKKINLNKWMVRNGYAVAYKRYSIDYVADEEYAKKNKLGLWSGSFIYPEKWRKLN
jgi:endonuclease YncB( thermonuclease family)